MGKARVTKGQAVVGSLAAAGAVQAGSVGFTCASVALRLARIPVSCATTGERTYAFTFPVGAVIQRVYLDVNTQESTASAKTIDIGLLSSETSGDADGFLDGVSTASAGIVQGSTAISAAARTLGVLMLDGSTASSDLSRKDHIVRGANAVTLSSTVSELQTELVADIVVQYLCVG
mgnify:CR=1 FL=1